MAMWVLMGFQGKRKVYLNLKISVGHFFGILSPLSLIPLNPNISVGHVSRIMPIKGISVRTVR